MEQIDFLSRAVETLDELVVRYMVVGSYACLAYGESRFTQDIDIVVDLAIGDVPAFCRAFPSPESLRMQHSQHSRYRQWYCRMASKLGSRRSHH